MNKQVLFLLMVVVAIVGAYVIIASRGRQAESSTYQVDDQGLGVDNRSTFETVRDNFGLRTWQDQINDLPDIF